MRLDWAARHVGVGWRRRGGGAAREPRPLTALFTFKEILLASSIVALTLLVRGGAPSEAPLVSWSDVLLHPVWVAAVTGIFGWSTFVNGVLGRNEWRGRVRDAGTLEF